MKISDAQLAVSLMLIFACGCGLESQTQSSAPAKPKTTQDIGEFDPNAGTEVVSNKVQITNPLTAALEAYQPLKQQIAGLGVEHAVNLFQALEGRYPKDYDEFMQRIIVENNMRLPSLPNGLAYQYDVPNHKLVVVRSDTGAVVE
jgi:hypothetical protein